MDAPRTPYSALLCLPALLYEGLVRIRNRLYDLNILPGCRLPGPVISVGNLTTGGSGKTPLVLHLCSALKRMGATTAVLTRGYGRPGPIEPVLAEPGRMIDNPAIRMGDEPALLHRHFPDLWIGVDAARSRMAQKILERCVRPVFVLDDGFQHRAIKRDLDMVILDSTQDFNSNHLLPWGSLREPLTSLKRAGSVVLNIPQPIGRDRLRPLVERLAPQAQIFTCTQKIARFAALPDWLQMTGSGDNPIPVSAFLFAAIGNPGRFRSDAEACGIVVRGTWFGRDHSAPSPGLLKKIVREARRQGAEVLLITEKDAVKLPCVPDFPVLVAIQETRVEPEGEFDQLLRRTLRSVE